jgi:hypothetical protein
MKGEKSHFETETTLVVDRWSLCLPPGGLRSPPGGD